MQITKNRLRPGAARAAGRLAALGLGALLALALGEAAVRLAGGSFRLSQQKSSAAALAAGGLRIMCLGESTTAGGGDVWPALLERVLAARYPQAGIRVANKGVPAANTSDLLRYLPANLDEVRPGLVIAMMGMNDGFVRYYEGISGAGGFLFTHSRLYRLAAILRTRPPAPRKKTPPRQLDPYLAYAATDHSLGANEAVMAERLRRNPGDAEARYVLGRYLALVKCVRGRREGCAEGARLLERAVELRPEDGYALTALAEYSQQQGDFDRAVPMMERAARLTGSAQTWFFLGRICSLSGRSGKAEEALRKAAELEGAGQLYEEAIGELSYLYLKSGKRREAESLLLDALAGSPGNEKLLGALATHYGQAGETELAEKYRRQLKVRRSLFNEVTLANFAELRRQLDARGVRLAVMQYPLCELAPLREALGNPPGVLFIDNDRTFRKAVAEKGYVHYFVDMFAGNFGLTTEAGHRLIAENAADALAPLLAPAGAGAPRL